MKTKELAPQSSKKAQATAVNSFERFARHEGYTMDEVHDAVQEDSNGALLVAVMDKYALHIALRSDDTGKTLRKSTVTAYFGQVTQWMLASHDSLRHRTEHDFNKIDQVIEKYVKKRDTSNGTFTNKAQACTKPDLQHITHVIYAHVSTHVDYGDVALLCLMWHLFGRSSDTMLSKSQLSVFPGGALYLSFGRFKTTNNQGAF